jgi:hypothetical protein
MSTSKKHTTTLHDFVKTTKGHCYQIVNGKKVRIPQSKYDEWIAKLSAPPPQNKTKTRTKSSTKKKKKSITKKKAPVEEYIRFYDDSPENIADVITHGSIECIHVPRVNTLLPRGMSYNEYVRTRGGWKLQGKDADLQQVLDTLRSDDDVEEFSDSLTEAHMSELRQWVRKKPEGSCRVMFDFDRVINQVEGMIAGSLKTIQEQKLNVPGLAKYHIGTKKRWLNFRKTIDELLKHGTNVSVVTNNPGCQDESFVAVLNFIHPVFTKENVHCSHRFANKLNCMSARKLVV